MPKRIVIRSLIAIAGACVILIGLVMLPLPGPGAPIILAGFIILATEFVWARKIVEALKRRLPERLRFGRKKSGPKS